jgi:hypothetical protein
MLSEWPYGLIHVLFYIGRILTFLLPVFVLQLQKAATNAASAPAVWVTLTGHVRGRTEVLPENSYVAYAASVFVALRATSCH